jgi:hypothetical protein
MKSAITTLFAILMVNFLGKAQSNTVTSGGNAAGSGGNVSYTVGQIDYISSDGSNGSFNQGVQQPYEIYSTSGLGEFSQLFDLSIGPNPTADLLYLSIKEHIENLSFSLADLNGKELSKRRSLIQKAEIDMSAYPVGTYLLTIYQTDKIIQSYKILKK